MRLYKKITIILIILTSILMLTGACVWYESLYNPDSTYVFELSGFFVLGVFIEVVLFTVAYIDYYLTEKDND